MHATRQNGTDGGAHDDAGPGSSRRPVAPAALVSVPWTVDVLVVDDDAADTALVIDALKRNPQVGAAIAIDAPDDALFQMVRGVLRPNLIILDIHMPKLNGFKFLEALRKIPWMQQTPVALMTTSRHSKDVEHARESDICTYVVKPDTYEELKTRVNHLVRQTILGGWER